MHKKGRKLTPRFASRLCITSPLALLVSGSFLVPAHANLFKPVGPPTHPAKKASQSNFNALVDTQTDRQLGIHSSQHLLVPASILDSRDSTLMRQLLLTHGIELDLSQSAQSQYVDEALLREIFSSKPLHKPVDFELVVADASGQIQLPDEHTACEPGFTEDEMEAGVSKSWKVLWIGSCEVNEPEDNLAASSATDSLVIESPVIDLGAVELQTPPTGAIKTVPIDQRESPKAITPDSSTLSSGKAPMGPPKTLLIVDPDEDQVIPSAEPSKLKPQKKSGGLEISEDVPAGFEALAGPQTNYVDVFFNAQKIGSTVITSTPEDFQFDDPTEVAMLLGDNVDSPDLETMLRLRWQQMGTRYVSVRMNHLAVAKWRRHR